MDMEEQKKREKRFNKKMKRAGLLILISFASFFAAGYIPMFLEKAGCPQYVAESVNMFFRVVYSVGTIIGVSMLVKSLHDPLTELEAKELEEKDKKEKTGEE